MRPPRFVVLVVFLLLLSVPEGLDSCAFSPSGPVFAAKWRPADTAEFLKGRIGVVTGAMDRRYMIAAYRMLAGAPPTPREASALYSQPVPAAEEVPPVRNWLAARQRVPGATQLGWIRTDKVRSAPGSFAWYENCLGDAFATAVRTLEERASAWGLDSPKLKEWLEAQDRVFSNCDGAQAAIPAPAPSGADTLLAADRRYQIAAARFYAGQWKEARQDFEEIARDAGSPWHRIAPYLAARTLIREATIANRPELLDEAASRLRDLEADPNLKPWYESSRKLREYIGWRRDPRGALNELASRLIQPGASEDFAADADSFLYVYYLFYSRYSVSAPPDQTIELATWIYSLEHGSAALGAKAEKRWSEFHNPAWLAAALAAEGYEPSPELIQDARHVAPSSPAYDSATYFGIAREMETGYWDEARQWADQALSGNLLLSTRNLILAERLDLAQSWEEFLQFAPRTPERGLFGDSQKEWRENPPTEHAAPILDGDTAVLFNSSIPLSLWLDASRSPTLPAHL